MPNKAPMLPDQLYTVEEIAQHLAVSIKSVRRWIGSGELRAYRIGHQLRISEEDLRSFLAARHNRKVQK